MILVECGSMNRSLLGAADALIGMVLEYVEEWCVTAYQDISRRYSTLSSRLLHPPGSSVDLVRGETSLETAISQQLPELEKHGEAARGLLNFLFKHDHAISVQCLDGARKVAAQRDGIDEIIQRSSETLTGFRSRAEQRLRQLRSNVRKTMESLRLRIDEFQGCNDWDRFREYTQALDGIVQRLQQADLDVMRVHEEEDLLGFATTDFKEVTQNRARLAPYLALWNGVQEVDASLQRWQRGNIFTLDADSVSADVDRLYRTGDRLGRALRKVAPLAADVAD